MKMRSVGRAVLAAAFGLAFFGAAEASCVDAELAPLSGFSVETKRSEKYKDGTKLWEAESAALSFADDGAHRALRDALRTYRKLWEEKAGAARAELKQGVQSYFREGGTALPFTSTHDIVVRRADALALSFLEREAFYTGGAHGMYGWRGVNLDAATGAALSLEDVFCACEALAEAVIEKLRAAYPDSMFSDMEDTVREAAAEGRLNWTLDPRGATVYFDPYEIAPYASGLLSVSILFDERPALFQEKYRRGAAAYIESFPAHHPLTTDLDDDGALDTLSVSLGPDGLRVEKNGQAVLGANVRDPRPMLVHLADGRSFLYIDGMSQSGARSICVYDLTGGVPTSAGVLPLTTRVFAGKEKARWQVPTDPDGFILSGGPSGEARYRTGAHGRPEAE